MTIISKTKCSRNKENQGIKTLIPKYIRLGKLIEGNFILTKIFSGKLTTRVLIWDLALFRALKVPSETLSTEEISLNTLRTAHWQYTILAYETNRCQARCFQYNIIPHILIQLHKTLGDEEHEWQARQYHAVFFAIEVSRAEYSIH